MKKTIKVFEIIGEPLCAAHDDGQAVFNVIRQEILNGIQLEISFEGIELIISAFLNVAIGQLYGEFSEEKIDNEISYAHLEEDDKELLNLVIANAKRYYRNQENYDIATKEVLEYA